MATRVRDLSETMVRAREGRDAGTAWLLGRIAPDGEPVGAQERNGWYRVPWTLAVVGERETAAAVLSWAEREALTADGDLRAGAAQGAFTDRWASYPLALLATGAWHLERYDTALALLRTASACQDPESGGSYAERPELRRTSRQDLFPTAQLGMSALTLGQLGVAEGAFRWLAALYDAQPELPRRLFTAWDEGGLMTDVPDELAFEVITDLHGRRQAFYNPGIAAAFLARYVQQTGDERARDLGRRYLALSAEGGEGQFDYTESAQICKFGWGAALMLEADPEGGHLPHVLRMAEWFCDSQLEDGRWHDSPFLSPEPTEGDDLEITAEFVLHLATILTALGGRDRGEVRAH